MQQYDENLLRTKVTTALTKIKTVLDNTKNPQFPADVPHRYEDKYLLAEFLTSMCIVSLLQCLENIGLSEDKLTMLQQWARTDPVVLRLKAKEDCKFLREETRTVETGPTRVVEQTSFLGGKTTKTEKLVSTVTDYFWRFEYKFEIIAYKGSAPDTTITILSRSGMVDLVTATNTAPRPDTVIRPHIDTNITWLLKQIDADSRLLFKIDRTAKGCHTPRRNPQIEQALQQIEQFRVWSVTVWGYFHHHVFTAHPSHNLDLSALNPYQIMVPVVPLFEQQQESVLPVSYIKPLLTAHSRSLQEKCKELTKVFPNDNTVITITEAQLVVTLMHVDDLCNHYTLGVDYVEDMLRKQLIAAIGKIVTPADFTQYMEFHYRKLFKSEYLPKPFSYAIRRPEHYPEGVLSVEAQVGGDSALPLPITTAMYSSEAKTPMTFALDAATSVSFLGERYLHTWISYQFYGQSELSLSLVARARQFSSFILLVGRIASATVFEPKFGVILQNKDVLKIPLMLEQIPTPKEFRDAIESLSPEQQRFAKAFRGMQLESTLFGVCVIQIKPQLEKLLKLPSDSLTKEISLTQDLLNLFIDYQIPSDLLSYDGPDESSQQEKIATVKGYVSRMREMIDQSKKKELDEAREREAFRLAEANLTPPSVPALSAPIGASPFGPPPPYGGAAPLAAPSVGPSMGAGPPGMGAPPPAPRSAPGMSSRTASAFSAPAPAAGPPPASGPAPAPAVPHSPPAQPQSTTAKPTAAKQPQHYTSPEKSESVSSQGSVIDYTRLPSTLDTKYLEFDEDNALRPTIINTGDIWTKESQKALLGSPTTARLRTSEQKTERNRTFDLIDALTKSGALTIDQASLHVVIAATHCFDKTLLEAVIQGNINPVEKVERSVMIMATTIHNKPAQELLAQEQHDRFFEASPKFRSLEAPKTNE